MDFLWIHYYVMTCILHHGEAVRPIFPDLLTPFARCTDPFCQMYCLLFQIYRPLFCQIYGPLLPKNDSSKYILAKREIAHGDLDSFETT